MVHFCVPHFFLSEKRIFAQMGFWCCFHARGLFQRRFHGAPCWPRWQEETNWGSSAWHQRRRKALLEATKGMRQVWIWWSKRSQNLQQQCRWRSFGTWVLLWSRWSYAEGEKETVSHGLLQVPHWVCSLNFQVIHIDALIESSIAKTWSNLQTPRHNLSKTVIKFSVHSIYNSFWAGW